MWTLHQAFAGTIIQGESEIGGQKMTSIGLGYITSQAGVTIGLGHATANKTDEGIVAGHPLARDGALSPQGCCCAERAPSSRRCRSAYRLV